MFRRFRPRLSGHKSHVLGRFPHVIVFDKTVVMNMDSIILPFLLKSTAFGTSFQNDLCTLFARIHFRVAIEHPFAHSGKDPNIATR